MILQILPKKVLSHSERTGATQPKLDFSNIKIKNKFIYNYKPNSYLKDTNCIINPYVSFKLVLYLVLLDIKGKVGFIEENSEGICDHLQKNKIKYFIEKKGPYNYLSIIQNLAS